MVNPANKSQLLAKNVLGQILLVQKNVLTGKTEQVISPTHFRVGIEQCDSALTVTGPIFSECPGATSVLSGNLIICGSLQAGSISGSETVKVSSNDTTAGFLIAKIVAGDNIAIAELNDGSAETLQITAITGSGAAAQDWADVLTLGRESQGINPTLTGGSDILGESGTTGHKAFVIGGLSTSVSGDGGQGGIFGGTGGATSGDGGVARVFGGDGGGAGGDVLMFGGEGPSASISGALLGIGAGDYGQARPYIGAQIDPAGANVSTPVATFVYDGSGASSASLHVRTLSPEHVDNLIDPPDTTLNVTGNVGHLYVDVGDTGNDSFGQPNPYSFARYPGLFIKRTNFISPGSPKDDGDNDTAGNARLAQEWWGFPQCRVTGSSITAAQGSGVLGSLRSVFPNAGGAIAWLDVKVIGVSTSGIGNAPQHTFCRRMRVCGWNRGFSDTIALDADLTYDYLSVPISTGEATGWTAQLQTSGTDIILVATGSSVDSTIWRASWTVCDDGIDRVGETPA